MSIYATLWVLKFPADGYARINAGEADWVTVLAQGVPSHIAEPYEFLPPPVAEDLDGVRMRAVVFVTAGTPKGTDRAGQEYVGPLLTLTGDEYAAMSFDEVHRRLCDALRGDRVPVVAEVVTGDGRTLVIYANGDARERKADKGGEG